MLKRRKISCAAAAVAVALAVAFQASLTAAPAAAKPAAAQQSAVTGVPARVPQVKLAVCNFGDPVLCANRDMGGTGIGTHVIGWPRDFDVNEDFEFISLQGMCNGGLVSSTCPFTVGGGLNDRYINRPIYAIKAYNENLCVATTSAALAVLNSCPNSNGSGGSNGDIFVYSNQFYLVNRYWSNSPSGGDGKAPNWMCVASEGDDIILNYPFGTSGICQWKQEVP